MGEENTSETTPKAPDVLEPKAQPSFSQADVDGLVNKKNELLGDNVKLKERLREFETAVDNAKTETLKEKEQYKELSEKLAKEKADGETVIKKKNQLIEDVNLKLVALEMHDPTDIVNYKHFFEFDEDHNITNEKEGLEKLKAKKAHLFKSPQQPGAVRVQHGNPVINTGGGVPESIDIASYKKDPKAVDDAFAKLLPGVK